LTRHPLLQQASEVGLTLWVEDGRLRWKARRQPPSSLLAALRERRDELIEDLRPTPASAALLAFMEASAAAMAAREPDPEEEAERAAVFDLPPLTPASPASGRISGPQSDRRLSAAKRPLWESGTMEGRTLALMRTPGAQVVLERDGWLKISTPDGSYAFARREVAERMGWPSCWR
jgi:hypothetical protein